MWLISEINLQKMTFNLFCWSGDQQHLNLKNAGQATSINRHCSAELQNVQESDTTEAEQNSLCSHHPTFAQASVGANPPMLKLRRAQKN
jgi:hypothetical protein